MRSVDVLEELGDGLVLGSDGLLDIVAGVVAEETVDVLERQSSSLGNEEVAEGCGAEEDET